jgi:alkylhydroperoxidase/carboxymuconolactone decarboxylase family protein YurZ
VRLRSGVPLADSLWMICVGNQSIEEAAMKANDMSPQDSILGLAQGDPKILETVTQMTVATKERSGLDDETYMLVRIAALVATDAAPVSYLVNLGLAQNAGVDLDHVLGTMVAVAPVVGTARVASAASKMVRAGILGAELADAAMAGMAG